MNPIAYSVNIIAALVSAVLALAFVFVIGESSWIPTTIAGVIFLLNIANKHPLLHALILFYTIVIAICADIKVFGLEINVHYSFITITILPFLIFPYERKDLRISALFVLGILFFITVFFPIFFKPVVQLDRSLVIIVSGLFSGVNFIVFLYIVHSFTTQKIIKEKDLSEQINIVTKQKTVIEKAQNNAELANEELNQLYHKLQKQALLLKETQKIAKIGTWNLNMDDDTVSFSEETRILLKIGSHKILTIEEWSGYFSGIEESKLKQFISRLKRNFAPFEHEFLIKIGSGEESYIKIIGSAEVENNRAVRIYGVIQDITQVYENEKLRNAKIEAENLASAKALFLAKMSHEIRTPINGVMGITHLMLKTELSEKQIKYAKAIETSSDTLLMIVNDILDISKIEAGKMIFEKKDFEIKELIHSIYEMFLNKVTKRSISLVYHFQEESIKNKLIGDPTRLNQILYNLIGNAIKFTSHGHIEILVSGTEKENNVLMTKITIKDSGIGIEKSKLDHIFESFAQAESDTTRKYGGTGLGLSIVKQLVELQGGTISVRSEIGVGSEFEIVIPYEIQSEENRSSNQKEIINVNKHLIKGIKILLVEDNPINQMVIKDMLEAQGAIIEIANNGLEAVEIVKTNSFEIVLMDMQMPVMDGYEAMRNIREKLLIPRENLPIIALTAHVMEGEMKKCLNSGANDYISKPFKPNELYRKILTLTNRI